MDLAFPYAIDGRGRTAAPADTDAHVRQLIEQLLFTNPGERVNRPNLGSGLLQMVFAPNSDELAAATQFVVQGGLQQWLGHRVQVVAVEVQNVDSQLLVTVQYILQGSQTRQVAQFARGI
jgi:uncharacterized protein